MKKEFQLTNRDINIVTEEVKNFFTAKKIPEEEVIKLSLLIEEVLLRYRDRFGKEKEAVLITSDFPSAKVRIRIQGDGFNPLREDDAEESILGSEFLKNLLESDVTSASFSHYSNYDEVSAMAYRKPKLSKIPGGAVTVAAFLAFLAAFASRALPAGISAFLLDDLVIPMFSTLMGMIVMVSGPMICISVICGICALGDIATLSTIGLRAIRRFFGITLIMITFTVCVNLLIFPGISSASNGALDLSVLIQLLLDLIPQDLFSPFAEGKSIQIIVIAVAVGVAILMLDEKIPRLRDLVNEVNQLIFKIMELVSKVIPLTVFLSVYKAVSENSTENILSVWKLILANYASMVPFTALMVLFVCLRRKLNVRQFLKDISEPAMIAFTTCSSTLAMSKQFDTAKNVLKKDPRFVDFWVPLSHAMFAPAAVPALVSAAFFAGRYSGMPLSLTQIVILYILVSQLSIASPKVPGGIMATFSILLSQLWLPADIVGLIMIANVFVVNAETGLAMIIRSAELEEFSHVLEDENLTLPSKEAKA